MTTMHLTYDQILDMDYAPERIKVRKMRSEEHHRNDRSNQHKCIPVPVGKNGKMACLRCGKILQGERKC